MQYQVRVFTHDLANYEIQIFTKIQDAHSFMVFQSRKLAGEFFKLAVCNGQGEQLEMIMGKVSRR